MGCLWLFVSSPAFLSSSFSFCSSHSSSSSLFPFYWKWIFSHDIFWLWFSFPLLPISPHLPVYADLPPSCFLSHYNINRLLRDNIYLSVHQFIYLCTYLLRLYIIRIEQNKTSKQKEMSVGNRYRFRDWLIDIFRKPNKTPNWKPYYRHKEPVG